MDELSRRASRLDAAATAVRAAAGVLRRAQPGPAAFGADAAGLAGELGLALSGEWTQALDAREREALRVAGRLVETASAVRGAARAYTTAEAAVVARIRRSTAAGEP